MTDQDHKDLSMVLHACQGKVAISGYQSELYDSLYDDWTCHKKDIVSRTSPSTKKSARVECLWVNY